MEIEIKKNKPEIAWIVIVIISLFCFHENIIVSQFSIFLLIIVIITEIITIIPEKVVIDNNSLHIDTTDYLGLNKKNKSYLIQQVECFYGKVPTSVGSHFGLRIFLKTDKGRKKIIEISEYDLSVDELKKARDELKKMTGENCKIDKEN